MSRSNFEVQTRSGDRWVISDSYGREEDARQSAEALAANAKIEGVRIVRDWQRNDGRHVEKVLFEHVNEIEKKVDLAISPIEDAPLCDSADDLRGPDSRAAINRLFRKYLEEEVLTPTELMYNYQPLRRLVYQDTLLPSAVGPVSRIRGPGPLAI